ncbi:MAG TPA: ATP-binding cassette domain-containing protein [Chloroflexota bacterium]|nr:ATP-binding cassette domain-containing protein [Chloroflexota bacterium]
MASEPAVEVVDLKKTYGKSVRALDGVSFRVDAGTVFAILGPNGAGKSTTVKILTTLSRPDSGTATVAGIDVLNHPGLVRRHIGCVGQKSGVDREATGRENLALQGHIFGLSGRALKMRVSDLLDRFALSDAGDRVVRTYSGGMSRRLDIAIGLIHRPEVLFLDEPTTGLDPEVRVDMWQEIARLADEENITVVLTTHYLEEADRLAERLVIVDRGRIVAQGTPNALKSDLGGDTIQVTLRDSGQTGVAAESVAGVEGVDEVTTDSGSMRARTINGAVMVPTLLAALEAQAIAVASVVVARPSLDDVYLKYAGRRFDRADQEGGRS